MRLQGRQRYVGIEPSPKAEIGEGGGDDFAPGDHEDARTGGTSRHPRCASPVEAEIAVKRLDLGREAESDDALQAEVTIYLVMNDGFTDLVHEGIYLAIRIGEITDPGLITRRIGTTRRVTVASPTYLTARRTPSPSADPGNNDCIAYPRFATGNR